MKIIAKTTEGFIIEATNDEVVSVLSAVTGSKPKEIPIGQKIPAIDYASTIEKIKSLNSNTNFKYLVDYADRFKKDVDKLTEVVCAAANIDV